MMKTLLVMVVMCIAVQVTQTVRLRSESPELKSCLRQCKRDAKHASIVLSWVAEDLGPYKPIPQEIAEGPEIELMQCKRSCTRTSNREKIAARKESHKNNKKGKPEASKEDKIEVSEPEVTEEEEVIEPEVSEEEESNPEVSEKDNIIEVSIEDNIAEEDNGLEVSVEEDNLEVSEEDN